MAAVFHEVFKRVEKKYILSAEVYRKFREKIQEYMIEDEYGLSTISNIYYDTEDHCLISRSMDKPIYKEKLRLRCYGVPEDNSTAFVEIKKKYKGVVYKRRISLPLWEAEQLLETGECENTEVNAQILKEIQYFLDFYKPEKEIYLAYDRIALYGREDEHLRMTFDFNIRARNETLDLKEAKNAQLYFRENEVLMEIKTMGAYPMWLVAILEELKIYPHSFSKYAAFYRRNHKKDKNVCDNEKEPMNQTEERETPESEKCLSR